jgi:hypothetical protein
MEEDTIFSVAEASNASFTALLSPPGLRKAERAQISDVVEEEQAKFRIWAAHTGAFAEYHASLDYRLRESETVRSLVVTQLRLLQRSISRLLESFETGKICLSAKVP